MVTLGEDGDGGVGASSVMIYRDVAHTICPHETVDYPWTVRLVVASQGETFSMPTIIKSATVLQASLKWPLNVPRQRDKYGIRVRDEAGANRRFVAVTPPAILSADGEPLTLAAEIGTGAIVNLRVDGDALLTVQVLKNVAINPFDSVA